MLEKAKIACVNLYICTIQHDQTYLLMATRDSATEVCLQQHPGYVLLCMGKCRWATICASLGCMLICKCRAPPLLPAFDTKEN